MVHFKEAELDWLPELDEDMDPKTLVGNDGQPLVVLNDQELSVARLAVREEII